jgi:chromosome segregation ATPase
MAKHVTVTRQPDGEHVVQVKEFPVFSWETIKNIFYIFGFVGAIFLFVWQWQRAQDEDVSQKTRELRQEIRANGDAIHTNGKAIERSVESADNHEKHAAKAFGDFKALLTEQRKVISDTRETLSGVDATQKAIKEENGRLSRSIEKLAEEVRKSNGRPH